MPRSLYVCALVAAVIVDTPALLHKPAFPLRISRNQRHLEDSGGTPFRVHGDSAWSLVAQLDARGVNDYLDDRAARGFNAIIVNVIEHKFASNAPADRDGVRPFLAPGVFRDPNPAYFAKAHRVVDEARRRGIAVWLCPAYLGWGGGDEGFFQEIASAGPSALRDYGRFVGRLFKDLPNVVWLLGGDYAFPPSLRWLGNELAAGLREGGARQLISGHGGQTEAVDTFGDQPWLAVDTVYSYAADPRPPLMAAYERTPVRPFVLIEAVYEGEHDARPEQIRRQAWTAMLSGAAGQFFGNNPVWHFDGPALFAAAGHWRGALDSAGARDLARLDAFFRSRRWIDLEPDREASFVRILNDTRKIAAARSSSRKLAVAYLPADISPSSELSLTLGAFPRPMAVSWLDPSGGVPPRDGRVLEPSAGDQRLTVPAADRRAADWVLVLEAR